jgi:hypothetical protein
MMLTFIMAIINKISVNPTLNAPERRGPNWELHKIAYQIVIGPDVGVPLVEKSEDVRVPWLPTNETRHTEIRG